MTSAPLRHRPAERHPLTSRCPLHLRRVCGVCTHYDGNLRDTGTCTRFGGDRRGGQSAADCDDWERRWKGAT